MGERILNKGSKKNIIQKVHAYSLYLAGHSQTAILEKLKNQFRDNAISLRTLSRWISDFRNLPESITTLDEPFQWDKSDLYGISWNNSLKLLELCHYYYESEAKTPTGRQAIWWWRVSQAAPDLKANQISELGNLYTEREIMSIISNRPPVFDDLNAYITYKPYHTNRIRTYARFINAYQVEAIKPQSDESNAPGGLKNTL
ncbi:MAG: hypothetical protein VX383_06180 [Chloroflexota bacterium]|nr:hypothetical protein [Chloroflexota bacterium]